MLLSSLLLLMLLLLLSLIVDVVVSVILDDGVAAALYRIVRILLMRSCRFWAAQNRSKHGTMEITTQR